MFHNGKNKTFIIPSARASKEMQFKCGTAYKPIQSINIINFMLWVIAITATANLLAGKKDHNEERCENIAELINIGCWRRMLVGLENCVYETAIGWWAKTKNRHENVWNIDGSLPKQSEVDNQEKECE